MQDVDLNEEDLQRLRAMGYENREGMSTDIPDAEEMVDESSIESENPIIRKIIQENLPNLREGANFQQPTNYVETRKPDITDIEGKLEYTSFRESSNKPWQINKSKPSAPTTGYFHIEQPTYVEQMKKLDVNEANKVARLNPDEYVRYVQSNKDREREVAKKIISDKVSKHGEAIVIDDRGKPNPAWRVAYTMGDAGFRRYLKNTKQEVFNEE